MRIFGILYLDDKRTDIDKKGNHLKKFQSLYNNTNMIIKTKRKDMHRTYCIINDDNMSVNEYVNINEITNELLEKMATCNWTMKINHNNLRKDSKEIEKLNYLNVDYTPNRINYDAEIISVDPDGCEDIDDAISYKIINNQIEIGIHIADPTSYIEFNSELSKEFMNRCESVYLDRTYHMIPENIGKLISLKKGEIKRAYSLIITFDSCNIMNISDLIKNKNYKYKFIKTNIFVKENLSYEDFTRNLHNKNYKDIYDIGYNICNGLKVDNNNYDSHKMIGGYMILCNHLASNHTFIHRINKIKEIKEIKNNIIESDKLYQLYKNCFNESANYIINDNNSNIIHESIGLSYTHFTSPMRRYIDFLNHYIIFNQITDFNKIIEPDKIIFLDKINNIHKYYKKIYNIRNINCLIENKNNIIINGTIIFIELNKIRVLINNLIINIKIFNKKILENKIIEVISQNESEIIFKYKDNQIKFELFQSINIEIYKNKMEINPFRFIIDKIYFF